MKEFEIRLIDVDYSNFPSITKTYGVVLPVGFSSPKLSSRGEQSYKELERSLKEKSKGIS